MSTTDEQIAYLSAKIDKLHVRLDALEQQVGKLEAWRERLIPTLERMRDNIAGGFADIASALEILEKKKVN